MLWNAKFRLGCSGVGICKENGLKEQKREDPDGNLRRKLSVIFEKQVDRFYVTTYHSLVVLRHTGGCYPIWVTELLTHALW